MLKWIRSIDKNAFPVISHKIFYWTGVQIVLKCLDAVAISTDDMPSKVWGLSFFLVLFVGGFLSPDQSFVLTQWRAVRLVAGQALASTVDLTKKPCRELLNFLFLKILEASLKMQRPRKIRILAAE